MAIEDKTKSMYFVKVDQEDDGMSNDSQEGLGWMSRVAAVHNLQTYGVNQMVKVSRKAKEKKMRDSLPRSQWVKDLTVECGCVSHRGNFFCSI